MGEKTVVTWVCDQCKKESEPLHGGLTFNWNYGNPDGWVSWYKPEKKPDQKKIIDGYEYYLASPVPFIEQACGVGNDPRLMPRYPRKWTFCCAEHRDLWIAEHYPESEPSEQG